MTEMSKFKLYAKTILLPVILGSIVGFIISGSMDYNQLEQPPLSPPAWLFPIVWTILYILMGISFAILKEKGLDDSEASRIYYAQLIANLAWPIVFFVFKWRLFAFFWLLLLIGLVAKMIIEFYKRNNLSGILQIPYIVWLIYAAYLNLGVYLLN